jgi:hypothetical protein
MIEVCGISPWPQWFEIPDPFDFAQDDSEDRAPRFVEIPIRFISGVTRCGESGCSIRSTIDPARNQRHRIPTHFRKKRGNGWGTLTVFSCLINKDGNRSCEWVQRDFFRFLAFNKDMRERFFLGVFLLTGGLILAQSPAIPRSPEAAPSRGNAAGAPSSAPAGNPAANPVTSPVVLEWTPPALAELSAEAATRSSFTLDRAMLTAASNLLSDADEPTRQAIAKIDGVSVHLLRFGPAGIPDESPVREVRAAYHLRGWKHLISTASADGNPLHSGTTDVWLVLDGVNVRGAVVLVESPKSLTLATLTGNLSPEDLLHLRGHFGIPRFDADGFKDAKDK